MPVLRRYSTFSKGEARAVRDSNDPDEIVAARHRISVADVQTARRKIIPMSEKIGTRNSRTTWEEAAAIRQMAGSPKEIAKATGKSLQVIYNILARRSLPYVAKQPGEYIHIPGRRRREGIKLTEAIVRAILADDRPVKEIAQAYDLALATVYNLKNGKSWKHITDPAKRVPPADSKWAESFRYREETLADLDDCTVQSERVADAQPEAPKRRGFLKR